MTPEHQAHIQALLWTAIPMPKQDSQNQTDHDLRMVRLLQQARHQAQAQNIYLMPTLSDTHQALIDGVSEHLQTHLSHCSLTPHLTSYELQTPYSMGTLIPQEGGITLIISARTCPTPSSRTTWEVQTGGPRYFAYDHPDFLEQITDYIRYNPE